MRELSADRRRRQPVLRVCLHAGPRITLPIGPVELFGDWQAGGIAGSNGPSPVTESDTAWGFTTGGGLSYSINDNLMLGLFGRWDWYNMHVHGCGKLRYSTVGLALTLQESPPPAPPAPARWRQRRRPRRRLR